MFWNVKGNKYLCNRKHIRHSSFSTISRNATRELLEEGLLPVHTYTGVWALAVHLLIWLGSTNPVRKLYFSPNTHVPVFSSLASRRIISVYYQ